MRGAVVFSRDDGWLSRAIRWFTNSPVSHTAVVIGGRGDKLVLLDIDSSFVRITNKVRLTSLKSKYGKRKNPYVELYMPHANPIKIQEALDSLLEWVDTPYSTLQIFGFALVLLLRRFGIFIGNPFYRGIVCARLEREYLVKLGFDDFEVWDRNVMPRDLYEQVRRSPRFTRVTYEFD